MQTTPPSVYPNAMPNRRIAIYASTFDPPSNYHRAEVDALLKSGFDEVVLYPTGPRPLKGEHEHAAPIHRAAIASLAFRGVDKVTIDFTDLSLKSFSSPPEIEAKYADQGEVWHVVNCGMTAKGNIGESLIQTQWSEGHRFWLESRFVVIGNQGTELNSVCLPPHNLFIPVPERPSSAELRDRVYRGESIADCVDPDVNDYILRHRLFVPDSRQRRAGFCVGQPRLLIEYDERNPTSIAIAKKYSHYHSDSPNLILVLGGDGTMLRAIREHWQLRVPFVGLNTGHLGFLMNERLPDELLDLELVSYNLPMLRVDAKKPDGETTWGLAFSDVWLERAEGQAAWLRVDIDGETRVAKVVGDGMLVSTAAGSSAYARAMGAVPVPIDTPTLTLAGSNIFQPRFWKPMILSDESIITISSLDYSGKRPLRGFIDGLPLGMMQEITVKRSLSASVELAFTKQFDPSARLLRSLFPPGEELL
jgi:NAD kinase